MTATSVGTLLRAQLRIWLAQRGLLVGIVLALAVALASVGLGSAVTDDLDPALPARIYAVAWLAIGSLAGAAPFRSRWAAVVLVVAPRRLRWLATCYGSVLAIAMAAAVVYGVLAAAIATFSTPAAGAAVLTHLWQPLAGVLLTVSVGFFLGAATRATAAALTIGFVVAPAVAAFDFGSLDVGRWVNLQAVTDVFITARLHDGLPMPTVLTALCTWLLAPVLITVWRLKHAAIR
jgi:hypothetical protein